MTNIIQLSNNDIDVVSGGTMLPGESLVEYLERRFPGGEWVDGSFFPNGFPF